MQPVVPCGRRRAFAIIYTASVALWLGSVLLLLRIVREATGKKVSPTAAAVIAVLFLCETHLNNSYLSGLETGLHLTLCLALLLAFQFRLDKPAATWQQAAGLGALCGAAITSNVYWVWRDFNLPFRGFMGKQAYEFVRSPYAREGLRLGLGESGRLGFLYPDRVVNLDGKMRVDALRALRDRKIADFLRLNNFDYLLLRPFDAQFFDELSPSWRKDYRPAGSFDFFDVFSRVAH